MLKFPFAILFVLFWGVGISIVGAQSSSDQCPYLAPNDFSANNVGPTWVNLTWTSISPTTSYLISIYDSSHGFISSDTTPLNASSYIFSNLTPGTHYFFRIQPICQNGTSSINFFEIDITTILVDLVYQHGNPPEGNRTCEETVKSTETVSCLLNIGQSNTFIGKFTRNENGKGIRFSITYFTNGNGSDFKFALIPKENYENFADPDIKLLTHDFYNRGDGVSFIRIYDSKNLIGSIGFLNIDKNPNNDFYLEFTASSINVNRVIDYTLEVFYGGISFDNPGDRIANISISSNPSILPNPTTTTLQIQIPQTFTSPVQGTLLTLSGAVVQRYGLEAGVNTVSTANLSPGIYFLRLEGPGYAETFKVVKVE